MTDTIPQDTTPQTDTPEPSEHAPARTFDRHMLAALVCPVTHGRLDYDATRQELVSLTAGLAFPIRDGIPIMLIDEARQIKAD